MMKERMFAIIVGGLLLFSVAGFALGGLGRFGSQNDQPVEVPNVMEEFLSNEQVASILRTGRVLIRNVYTGSCSECSGNNAILEVFTNSFDGYIILEKVMIEPDNTTVVHDSGYVKLEMISPNGDIVDLNGIELNQKELTEKFCAISVIQPKECLLMNI